MERILITKLVRDGDRADLYARGHQYKDLTLFDLSDLADVGLDYANLENSVETPCRFWAVYELSDKLNKAGNPYKDVVMLEPIDTPATTTSVDNSAVLAELRAIRALLQVLVGGNYAPIPEEELDQLVGRAEPEPETEEETEPTGPVPTSLEQMVGWSKGEGLECKGVGHLIYGIRKMLGNGWEIPVATDRAEWERACLAWREYHAGA